MRKAIAGALILGWMVWGAAPAGAADFVRIRDAADRQVDVPRSAKRLIAMGPGALRLLCYLGAAARVAGVEGFEKSQTFGRPYMLAYPELAKLPPIGPGGPSGINREPDLEAVLRISPQIIFATYLDPGKADELQRKLSIPVVVLAYGSEGAGGNFDAALYGSLRIAGKIIGAEKRAEEVIGYIEKARQELLRKTEGAEEARKPRVYAGGIGLRGMQGIESTDTDYAPFAWVRARNLARETGRKGHLFVEKEKILSWDPDMIFIDAWGLNVMRQDYQRRPDFYGNLKAIREKRSYVLYPFNMYTTNIETVVADAYAAAKWLYPDRFADLAVDRKAAEVFSFFLKRPVYPEMRKNFGDLGQVADLGLVRK